MSARDDDGKSGKKIGPAWMGKRKAPVRGKASPDWKDRPVKPANAEAQYQFKRAALWIACLALFAAFVIYLIPPKNTPLVIFRAGAYPLQFPPLALAKEDEIFLKKVSPINLPVSLAQEFTSHNLTNDQGTHQRFLADLEKSVEPSGPGWFSRNNLVIFYISAHGLVNDKGEACLVPPSADAFDTRTWLPVEKLLKDICRIKKFQRVRKLVLLDCNRISMKWRSGVMDNRFADQLPAAVDAVNDKNLYVLNSTSPGEQAWAAPELKGSVFGHFAALGLRGDASWDYPRDRSRYVISLLELRDYLRFRVDGYVRERRGVRQTPMLIGGEDGLPVTRERDFPIASAAYWYSRTSAADLKSGYDVLGKAQELIQPSGDQPPSLQLAWDAYQRRATAQADDRTSQLPLAWRRGFVMDPVRWAALEQKLLALEERLFAGEDYQENLASDFAAIHQELSDANWQEKSETQTVTNLRLARWQQKLAAVHADVPDQTTDISGLYDEWLDAKPEDRKNKTYPTEDQPRAILELLTRFKLTEANPDRDGDRFTYDRLNSVLEFLHIRKDAPPVAERGLLVEPHFLKLVSLNGQSGSNAETWLDQAIRSRNLAEQAATPLDERAHYAVELLVNRADAARRKAEDSFFLGNLTALEGSDSAVAGAVDNSAKRNWRVAEGGVAPNYWEADSEGYEAARRWGAELERMFLLRDEIWALSPQLAEWYFRRWRLEMNGAASDDARKQLTVQFQQNLTTLNDVFILNVPFAEQLERLLGKRDVDAELRTELKTAQERFENLNVKWEALRALVAEDAQSRNQSEKLFKSSEAVRHIEQVMQTPLYADARAKGLLLKYLNTLRDWSTNDVSLPQPVDRAALESTLTKPAAVDESVFLEEYVKFLVNMQKVMTHEFDKPFEQRIATSRLSAEFAKRIDEQLRLPPPGNEPTLWQTLESVLTKYDSQFTKAQLNVGTSGRVVTMRRALSIWDQRVRVSAPWLSCFDPELQTTGINSPTPTAWLRQVDWWHVSCWHGYRILQDFLGNGTPETTVSQFFELAAEQCSKSSQVDDLPFQYDVAGDKNVQSLTDLLTTRQVAHNSGIELRLPNQPQPKIQEVEVQATLKQRSASPEAERINFPPGEAGFYLSRAGSLTPLDSSIAKNYENEPKILRKDVPINDERRDVDRTIHALLNIASKDSSTFEGHVWYRGHVWSQRFEIYNGPAKSGIRYVFQRPSYSPPTVEVSGKSGVSGAVMFVFDCSRSMQAPGRFGKAKAALKSTIDELKLMPDTKLRVGLMAYGHRTPALGGDPLYWEWDPVRKATAPLLPAGTALGAQIKNFPHPDLDFEVLASPKNKWADDIDDALDILGPDRLRGATPLYASIAKAIDELAALDGVTSRQVIVLSDGVNMPYFCDADKGSIDTAQNTKDLALLTSKMKSNVQVKVILFGTHIAEGPLPVKGPPRGLLEAKQLRDLKKIAAPPLLDVQQVDLTDIKEAIFEGFGKTTFAIEPMETPATAANWKKMNQIWTDPQWPRTGDLLLPQAKNLLIRSPKLPTPLTVPLQLTGPEALYAKYDHINSKVEFPPDRLEWFETKELAPVGNARPLDKPIFIQTLQPVLGTKTGDALPMTFRLRMGKDDSTDYIPWPQYVWAEFRPLNPGDKDRELVYQISDLRFEDKKRTPILQFPIENWKANLEGAKVDIWVRYGFPAPEFAIREAISPADPSKMISGTGKGLDGVEFIIKQSQPEGNMRRIEIIERHPPNTPLSKLYRTRVQLSPPAERTERQYFYPTAESRTSEVVHTFDYKNPVQLNADLKLEVNTPEQIKNGALYTAINVTSWKP